MSWVRGFGRHVTLRMSYEKSSLFRQRPPIREGDLRYAVAGATKIACHNLFIHQIGTAGVVHTSLSGVKSYD